MDDRERMERYLAWRRAEGKDRRERIRRRLRLTGALAAATLLIAALGIAVGGRPHLDTTGTVGELTSAGREVAMSEPVDPPASPTPSPSAREAPAPEGVAAAPAPAPAARPRRVRVSRPAPPSSGKHLPPRPATARPDAPTGADILTDAPASPRTSIGPLAAAPDDKPPAARDVMVTPPPAAASTVIVEPPPVVIVEPPAAAPTPPVATSVPAASTSQGPAASLSPPTRMQRLKELTGYIPEVWLARRVGRWVEQQPPGELALPTPERTQPQSR